MFQGIGKKDLKDKEYEDKEVEYNIGLKEMLMSSYSCLDCAYCENVTDPMSIGGKTSPYCGIYYTEIDSPTKMALECSYFYSTNLN